MKKTFLKKHNVFIFAAMAFLLVSMQQNISGEKASKFPGDEKLQLLWEFDSGG